MSQETNKMDYDCDTEVPSYIKLNLCLFKCLKFYLYTLKLSSKISI